MKRKVNIYELEEQYAEMLNGKYPICKIAGHDYTTAMAFKATDPVKFNAEFNYYITSLLLSNLVKIGDDYYFNN